MATFLETLSILEYFAPVLTALLVFSLVYAIITKTKILGNNKVVELIIAVTIGLLALLVPDAVNLINFMAPWFVLFFVFLFMVLLAFRFVGQSEENIMNYLKTDRGINWAILAIAILIVMGGIFQVFGQKALQATQDAEKSEFESNVADVLFSKQVLGMLVVLTIAIFAISFLGGKPAP